MSVERRFRPQGKRDKERSRLLARLDLPPVRGELPRMADVSLTQLRVRDAAIDVAYLNRDAEVDLGLAFEAKRSVLIVGDSLAGKTRLAAEMTARHFAHAPLLMASSGVLLREL